MLKRNWNSDSKRLAALAVFAILITGCSFVRPEGREIDNKAGKAIADEIANELEDAYQVSISSAGKGKLAIKLKYEGRPDCEFPSIEEGLFNRNRLVQSGFEHKGMDLLGSEVWLRKISVTVFLLEPVELDENLRPIRKEGNSTGP